MPNKIMYKEIKDFPKGCLSLCKKVNVQIDLQMAILYELSPDIFHVAYNLKYLSLNTKDIYNILSIKNYLYQSNTYEPVICTLVNEFGYTAKSLFLYLDELKTFEALENTYSIIRELYDYAKMMKEISPKFDKYPRRFLTTHRIACRNYERMKTQFDEEKFQKIRNPEYECTFDDYIFIYPKSTQDIKDEAAQQNNCVASYISQVIEGECHILFLRKKDSIDKSLVTIEVRGNMIVQAKRRFNDDISPEEQRIVDKWNKKYSKKIAA